MAKKNLENIRQDYNKDVLHKEQLNKDPLKQFDEWFKEMMASNLFYEPTSVIVSTADKEGNPSTRVVLLKSYDETGFVFYTNYTSQKGKNLAENPNISLLFFWDKLEKQVRIQGKAKKVSKEKSKEYFDSRPYESRIGAIASAQSSTLNSRDELITRIAEIKQKYPVNPPLPETWGGYVVEPVKYEFWQGRESRLHDRFVYDRKGNDWTIRRLYP